MAKLQMILDAPKQGDTVSSSVQKLDCNPAGRVSFLVKWTEDLPGDSLGLLLLRSLFLGGPVAGLENRVARSV